MSETGADKKPDFVVPIYQTFAGREKFLGTAFLVEKTKLLTANHVVAIEDDPNQKRSNLFFRFEDQRVDIESVEHFPTPDIALLTAATPCDFQSKVRLVVDIKWESKTLLTSKSLRVAGYKATPPNGLPVFLSPEVTPGTSVEDQRGLIPELQVGTRLAKGYSGSPAFFVSSDEYWIFGIAIEGEAPDAKITLNRSSFLTRLQNVSNGLDACLSHRESSEHFELSSDEMRRRSRYLRDLKSDIKARLDVSLQGSNQIQLKLVRTQGATGPLYQNPELREQFDSVEQAFHKNNGRLLLLGHPGSGKTTMIWHIAMKLIAEAEADSQAPIPLLVNLSGFDLKSNTKSGKQSDPDQTVLAEQNDPDAANRIQNWLVTQLEQRFQSISTRFANRWINKRRVVALFDGLDEVVDTRRAELVRLLNASYLKKHYENPVVVCSRIYEYQSLRECTDTRLQLNGAVTLQSLSDVQVRSYLKQADALELEKALERDPELARLAKTPLLLSMMTQAYSGLTADKIPIEDSMPKCRNRLMDAYVDRMLQRNESRIRSKGDEQPHHPELRIQEKDYLYHPKKVDRYLGWLAVHLSTRMQTECSFDSLYSLLGKDLNCQQDRNDLWIICIAASTFVVLVLAILAVPFSTDDSLVILLNITSVFGAGAILTRLLTKHEMNCRFDDLSGGVAICSAFGGCAIAFAVKSILSLNTASYIACCFYAVTFLILSLWIFAVVYRSRSKRIMYGIFSQSDFFSASAHVFPFQRKHVTKEKCYWLIGATSFGLVTGWLFSFWISPNIFPHAGPVAICMFLALCVAIGIIYTESDFVMARIFSGIGYSLCCLFLLTQCIFAVPLSIQWIWFPFLCTVVVLLFSLKQDAITPTLIFCFLSGIAMLATNLAGAILVGGIFWFVFILYFVALQTTGKKTWSVFHPLVTSVEILVDRFILSPTIRILLAAIQKLPFRLRRFESYCSDSLLLTSSKRQTAFYHRILRDYFALKELQPLLQSENKSLQMQALDSLKYQGVSAVETLGDYSSNSEQSLRCCAIRSLGHISAPETVPFLSAATKDLNPTIRIAAIESLSNTAKSDRTDLLEMVEADEEPLVQMAIYRKHFGLRYDELLARLVKAGKKNGSRRLIEILTDEEISFESRVTVAAAMSRLKCKDAVEPLLMVLDRFGRLAVRHRTTDQWGLYIASVEALGAIGNRRAVKPLIRELRRKDNERQVIKKKIDYRDGGLKIRKSNKILCLSDEPFRFDYIRGVIAKTLGELGDRSSVQPLLDALDYTTSRGRIGILVSLGDLGDKRAFEKLVATLRDNDLEVRQAAARSLGRLNVSEAIEPLIHLLRDKSLEVRNAAIDAIGFLPSRGLFERILKLSKSDNKLDRHGAVSIFGLLQDDRAFTILCESLQHRDATIRTISATAIGKLRSKLAVGHLIEMLEDSNQEVVGRAIEALGEIGDQRAVDPLIGLLQAKNSETVCKTMHALIAIGGRRAVVPLIQKLDSSEVGIVFWAVNSLTILGDKQAVEPLIRLLKHKDGSIVSHAAEHLAIFGDSSAIEPISVLLEEGNCDSEVREILAKAVKDLQGVRNSTTEQA